jgi:twinkle protein
MKSFEELGIDLSGIRTQGKTLCPQCSHKRKKSDDPCLSINTDTGLFNCHNCGWRGGTKAVDSIREHYSKKSFKKPVYTIGGQGLSDAALGWLGKRGLSKATLDANFVEDNGKFISFPYIKGDVVNVKYRSFPDKKFRMVKDAETCFYGVQNLFEDGHLSTKKIFITEGEIDALTLYECGFRYALSVPSGASVEEEGSPKTSPRLEYLDDPDIAAILLEVEEVILVTDDDYKGKRLREELSNRIGVGKCYSVSYPNGCKDINEVLVEYGTDAVISCILDAAPMMQGLVTVNSLNGDLLPYYAEGLQAGLKSGIEAFDNLYTLQFGYITLVTGIPEIKKSVMMDNIIVGYAKEHGIHSAYFSPETKPTQFHVGRLASIHNGFSLDIKSEDRMPYDLYKSSVEFIDKHVVFIQPKSSTIDEILELAKVSVLRYGTKVLVIDPYSRIVVTDGVNQHDFIRVMLNKIGEFAERYGVHVFIVAHPTKMETFGKSKSASDIKPYPIVMPYDIKGASEWYQSADFILSLWKDNRREDSPLRVYCVKSKYWHIAKSNTYEELQYNYDNWQLTSYEGLIDTEDLTTEEN